MGRTRSLAARNEERTRAPGSSNPSLGRTELQPESINPSLDQPKNMNTSLERAELQPKVQANSANLNLSLRTKVKKNTTAARVRRSERIHNAVMPAQNQDVERVIEEMILSESEKEDEMPGHETRKLSEETIGDKNLAEKIDYLAQLLEEALKSKAANDSSLGESPCVADVKYRSLYFDSQKKIEALTDDNHQLSMKLENALNKLEAYEKGTRAFSEVLEKLKDVILISNLTKAAETAVNVSSQAMRDAFTSVDTGFAAKTTAAKRKRLNKEGKN